MYYWRAAECELAKKEVGVAIKAKKVRGFLVCLFRSA